MKKKIDMNYNPLFNGNPLSIHKKCINKVCGGFNCVSNSKNSIIYLQLPIEFCLMRDQFLIFGNTAITRVFQ